MSKSGTYVFHRRANVTLPGKMVSDACTCVVEQLNRRKKSTKQEDDYVSIVTQDNPQKLPNLNLRRIYIVNQTLMKMTVLYLKVWVQIMKMIELPNH